SHNAASAADSSPGQIAFVMFEIRDDLVLPLQWHRNIILTHISSDRKFGACEHRRRCDEKTPSNRGFSISNPNQGTTCARPRALLRRCSSAALSAASQRFGSHREGTGVRKKNAHRRR